MYVFPLCHTHHGTSYVIQMKVRTQLPHPELGSIEVSLSHILVEGCQFSLSCLMSPP
jgi:hypothetical protein